MADSDFNTDTVNYDRSDNITIRMVETALHNAGLSEVEPLTSGLRSRTFVGYDAVGQATVVAKVVPNSDSEVQVSRTIPSHRSLLLPSSRLVVSDELTALIMEYQPGGSLKDVTRAHGVPRVAELVEVLEAIAAALVHLHKSGFVHGDIKPENIVLSSDGEPLLIDWGSTEEIGTNAATTGPTSTYAAPETLVSTSNPMSDIYSLGVVLYFLLTGDNPSAKDSGDVSPLFEGNLRGVRSSTQATDSLAKLAAKMMSNEPADRPTAEAVYEDLHSLKSMLSTQSDDADLGARVMLSHLGNVAYVSEDSPVIAGRASTVLPVGLHDLRVSRKAVEFFVRNSQLYVQNLSSWHSARIVSDTIESLLLPAGDGMVVQISDPKFTLWIEHLYAISGVIGRLLLHADLRVSNRNDSEVTTPRSRPLAELTNSQRELLLAYCEPILQGTSRSAASHTEAAKRLDISPYTARNRMQALVKRFAPRIGVDDGDKDLFCQTVIKFRIVKRSELTSAFE